MEDDIMAFGHIPISKDIDVSRDEFDVGEEDYKLSYVGHAHGSADGGSLARRIQPEPFR